MSSQLRRCIFHLSQIFYFISLLPAFVSEIHLQLPRGSCHSPSRNLGLPPQTTATAALLAYSFTPLFCGPMSPLASCPFFTDNCLSPPTYSFSGLINHLYIFPGILWHTQIVSKLKLQQYSLKKLPVALEAMTERKLGISRGVISLIRAEPAQRQCSPEADTRNLYESMLHAPVVPTCTEFSPS